MSRRTIPPALTLATILFACAPRTSDDLMADADAAVAARDFARGLAMYERLLDPDDELATPEPTRFKAALEAAKCEVLVGRAQDGIDRLRGMYRTFDAEMNGPTGYRHALAVLDALCRAEFADVQEKGDRLIEFVRIANEHHATVKDRFRTYVERIRRSGLTPEADKLLAELGYVS